MITKRLFRVAVATVLLLALPGAALAQDESELGPEGQEWTLTGYYDQDAAELMPVPITIEPTLLLLDGVASGFAGCNQFNGGYELDGGSLRFSEEMVVTLALCDDPAQGIEDTYLSQLGEVDGWLIDGTVLELTDSFGEIVLTFEVPSILWTPSQVTALLTALAELRTGMDELQGEIGTLRDDVEKLNVPKLRQRIKTLETDSKALKKRVDELEDVPKVNNPSKPVSFSSAEKTLLKGIPSRIANYCTPLRSSLPKSTRAAVTCRPNTSAVSSVDYYLMNGADAASQFGSVMDDFDVGDVVADDQTCAQGVKSQRIGYGNGWQAEGCYRHRGTSYVRFIDNAANCRKLKVNGKNMANPVMYMNVQGSDLQRAYTWATKNKPANSSQVSSITQPIPSNLAVSPSCGE